VEELAPDTLRPIVDGPTLSAVEDPPDDAVLRSELAGHLRDAIGRLPEDFRIVVLLRDVEGFDTAETAEMLGLTEAAVKSRLHRGRLAVRKALQPYLSEAVG
jgi:RNA polymerase sigma-70 factor (ECF subfamily)